VPESSEEFVRRVGLKGDPVAAPAAVVRVGAARFTVLTDRLLRLEWAADEQFEDRASYAFPTRRAPVPDFTVRHEAVRDAAVRHEAVRDETVWDEAVRGQAGTTVIDTGGLVLSYTPDGRPFHEGNLRVEVATLPGTRWVPGLTDPLNLGGARRTVDFCRGDARLEPGLVSRAGWALHDDANSMLFDSDGWVLARDRRREAVDWYFFGYGHDYPAAVQDYQLFGGSAPLIPRWQLGAWWSRYWPYTDPELRELVEDFATHDLPLDVVVIDMDWHLPGSWTGYTWNRELFPDPAGFLGWLHERGLHDTLNLHPALGVQPFEAAYGQFAEAMALTETEAAVPFHVSDPAFMRNYFQLLHHPLEDQGVDFWWMDWQQGRTFGEPGVDPLPWLNHLHFTDLGRHPDTRPITFSRWGGLGSHRYPIGFSGDAYSQWEALRFQPRYTAAGANVGYGWWSHDIGGHVGADDPELYVRWVQFGAMSPILRLHSNQDPASERRPWMFGAAALAAARAAFRLRYQLVPYLYTAARVASDTGIAPIRPMAWADPQADSAYAARYQYQLGDGLVVAPVMHPADPNTGLAEVQVWLPEGEWLERSTLERFSGPRWVYQVADLARIPQFVRLGTVLPLAEVAPTTAAQPQDHLILAVYSGADGSAAVYHDDGRTSMFRDGEFSWTTVSTTSPDPSTCLLRIEPGVALRVTVRLEGTNAPSSVQLDGAEHVAWRQEGLTTVIELPERQDAVTVRVIADGPLSALGPIHDAQVRRADLERLLGLPDADEFSLITAAESLPERSANRASAIARLGGPAVRVDEHTAPDEAANVYGRLVVGLGDGERAELTGSWTLERGNSLQREPFGPVTVTDRGMVLDAPFAWDGTRTPSRWTLQVAARWRSAAGEVTVNRRHQSAVIWPALTSWLAAVTAPDVIEAAVADWQLYQADPFDPDFAALSQRYVIALQHAPQSVPDRALLVHARTRLTVAEDAEVAFEYFSSDEVQVQLDGKPVAADVTGAPPSLFYDVHPLPRRTAAVHLSAGQHELRFRCEKRADLPWHQWVLSVSPVDPADARVVLGVSSEAPG
jgi:hypothetical protein